MPGTDESSTMNLEQNAETGQELTGFRRELRNRLIDARLAMDPARRAEAATAIEVYLERLLAHLNPGAVGFCWPFRGEFDARPLVVRLLAAGRPALLPVVVEKGAAMIFREWTPDAPMREDRYGIPVPAEGPQGVPDLLLMPVNGVDAAGYRLGYGGGYFDRTLASLSPRPVAVGVGFELARVDSIRPQPHDIPLDYLVTEAGVFVVRDGGLAPLTQ